MLILLLVSMLTLAFNIQPAKEEWTGTVYIRADGSIDPPDAPIKTYDNITYVLTSNVSSSGDGIVVERNNIILDGAGYTVQGPKVGYSVGILLNAGNITIKNMNVRQFYYGIFLNESSNNKIIDNYIVDNGVGILLFDSSNNSIIGNNVNNTMWKVAYGIFLFLDCLNNIISGNNIANNSFGILLELSSNNSITENMFVINDGLAVFDSYNNIVVNNLVNNKPLVYLENASNVAVEDAGQVILVNCNRVSVEGLNLSNTDIGLELWKTNNAIISGNNIANNGWRFSRWLLK